MPIRESGGPPPPPDVEQDFKAAAWTMKLSSSEMASSDALEVSADTFLRLHGLYQLGTVGPLDPTTTPEPSEYSFRERHAWSAWKRVSEWEMGMPEARAAYAQLLTLTAPEWRIIGRRSGCPFLPASPARGSPRGPGPPPPASSPRQALAARAVVPPAPNSAPLPARSRPPPQATLGAADDGFVGGGSSLQPGPASTGGRPRLPSHSYRRLEQAELPGASRRPRFDSPVDETEVVNEAAAKLERAIAEDDERLAREEAEADRREHELAARLQLEARRAAQAKAAEAEAARQTQSDREELVRLRSAEAQHKREHEQRQQRQRQQQQQAEQAEARQAEAERQLQRQQQQQQQQEQELEAAKVLEKAEAEEQRVSEKYVDLTQSPDPSPEPRTVDESSQREADVELPDEPEVETPASIVTLQGLRSKLQSEVDMFAESMWKLHEAELMLRLGLDHLADQIQNSPAAEFSAGGQSSQALVSTVDVARETVDRLEASIKELSTQLLQAEQDHASGLQEQLHASLAEVTQLKKQLRRAEQRSGLIADELKQIALASNGKEDYALLEGAKTKLVESEQGLQDAVQDASRRSEELLEVQSAMFKAKRRLLMAESEEEEARGRASMYAKLGKVKEATAVLRSPVRGIQTAKQEFDRCKERLALLNDDQEQLSDLQSLVVERKIQLQKAYVLVQNGIGASDRPRRKSRHSQDKVGRSPVRRGSADSIDGGGVSVVSVTSTTPSRNRQAYSAREDQQLREYVTKESSDSDRKSVSGIAFWRSAHDAGLLPARSADGMRERWRKHLASAPGDTASRPEAGAVAEAASVVPVPTPTRQRRGSVPKRKNIQMALRNAVWARDFGEVFHGNCAVCDKQLSITGFDAGHIISDRNGGETTLENLKVCCPLCNKSMGTLNLHEFKARHFG